MIGVSIFEYLSYRIWGKFRVEKIGKYKFYIYIYIYIYIIYIYIYIVHYENLQACCNGHMNCNKVSCYPQ